MAKGPAEDRQSDANRQRSIGDTAKALPVLAAALMFVPALWPVGTPTSAALIYIFAAWVGIILLTAIVSRALARLVRKDGRAASKGSSQ